MIGSSQNIGIGQGEVSCNLPLLDSAGFFLHAEAAVVYKGRAASTLERGDYVILKKPDGSIQIHASSLVRPRNFMSHASLTTHDNTLVVQTKSERIDITIFRVHHMWHVVSWSNHKVRMTRTEAELVDKIVSDPNRYLHVDPFQYRVKRELPVRSGMVDIVFFPLHEGITHVVEVKRRTVSVTAVYQVKRYLDTMKKAGYRCLKGYLAGPRISDRALSLCADNDISYFLIDWD